MNTVKPADQTMIDFMMEMARNEGVWVIEPLREYRSEYVGAILDRLRRIPARIAYPPGARRDAFAERQNGGRWLLIWIPDGKLCFYGSSIFGYPSRSQTITKLTVKNNAAVVLCSCHLIDVRSLSVRLGKRTFACSGRVRAVPRIEMWGPDGTFNSMGSSNPEIVAAWMLEQIKAFNTPNVTMMDLRMRVYPLYVMNPDTGQMVPDWPAGDRTWYIPPTDYIDRLIELLMEAQRDSHEKSM